ncbi:DddA-like double-stranded DNA deaminase toxin [Streptacidiphilus cavernicola]|uniref:DddA-like double-stranded DNA deaminase toxin n=1 Tax=Streptacidiphilus cavernicola TaxID=3342716 RepID=A0ABV6W1I8_9ACTN
MATAVVLALGASMGAVTTARAAATAPAATTASAGDDLDARVQAMADAAKSRADQMMYATIMHSGGPAMKADAGEQLAGRDQGPWAGWNEFLGSVSRDVVLGSDGAESDGQGLVPGIGPIAQTVTTTLANGHLHVVLLGRDGRVYDDVRYPDGTWSGAILIDDSTTTKAVAVAALPDGELHIEELSDEGKVTDRTFSPGDYPTYFMRPDGNGDRVLFDSLPGKVTGLAAVGTAGNDLYVAVLTADGKVSVNTRHTKGSSDTGSWDGLTAADAGTTPNTAIALATAPDGQAHLELLGSDHVVRDRVRNSDGSWAAATVVDATGQARAVSAVGATGGLLHVATLTANGTIADNALQSGGGWTRSTITAPQATAFSLGATSTGALQLQTTADDGLFRHAEQAADGGWGTAVVVEGAVEHVSDYASAVLPNGEQQLVTLDDDGTVWDQVRTAGVDVWSRHLTSTAEVDASGHATAVAVAGAPDNSAHLVVLDDAHTVRDYTRAADGSWSTASVADSSGTARAVSVAVTADGTEHLGLVRADGTVADLTRNGGSWSTTAVTTPAAKTIAAAATTDGSLHLLAAAADGKVYDSVRSSAGAWSAAAVASDGKYPADAVAATGLADGTLRLVALDSAAGTYSGHLRGTNGTWKVDTVQYGWPLPYATSVSVVQTSDGKQHIGEFAHPEVVNAFQTDSSDASVFEQDRDSTDTGLESFTKPYATSAHLALPQYDTDVTDYMSTNGVASRDALRLWTSPPVVKATQAAQDRVTQIVQELIAENGGSDPYGIYAMIGANTNSGSADDVRRFIQYHGMPTVAPVKGTPEFRVEVEALKGRWASGDTSNPLDWNNVLVEAEETASAEWTAELDSQAEQRSDILKAELVGLKAMETGARATHQALGYAWSAGQILDRQANPGKRQSNTRTTAQAQADLATLRSLVVQQQQIAEQAAAAAKAAGEQVDAAVAAADTVADRNGDPRGRGLYYAVQSAQVTKASAAAAQATAAALDTAVDAADASASDSQALLSNAQAQAAAARTVFLRESAQQSAQAAADLAASARTRADQAAAAASDVADAKADATQAQADATAAQQRAATAAANAETERQNAAAAKADAETQRGKAFDALKDSLAKGSTAAGLRSDSDSAAADAKKLSSQAQQAAGKATVARENAASAQRAKDVAEANAQALAAAAVAAQGTSAAADAQAAADKAAQAATKAAETAQQTNTDAESATGASVAARTAATESAAAAARSATWAADANANSLISFNAAMQAEAAAATAVDKAKTAADKAVAAAGDATDAAQAALAAHDKATDAAQQVDAALAAAAKAAGQAYAAGQAADVTRAAAEQVTAPANEALALGTPYAPTDSSAGLATLVSQSAQTLAQQQTAAADAVATQAQTAAQQAQAAADAATGDGKLAAQAAADAADSAAQAAASADAAQQSATTAGQDAADTKDAATATAAADADTQAKAKAASASALAASKDAQAADAAASAGEKDAAVAAATADQAASDAKNAQDVATQAAKDSAAADAAAAGAQDDSEQAEQAAEAAEEQLRQDQAALAAQTAAAQAAAQAKHDLDARAAIMTRQEGIRIGRENLAYLLHVGGVASKTVAANRLVAGGQMDGTVTSFFNQDVWQAWDADVQQARDQAAGMASRTDDRQETVWKYFTSDFANTEPEYDTAVTQYLGAGTVYQRIAQAVGWTGGPAQLPKASQAAQDKVAEILRKKIADGDPYGLWQLMLDHPQLRGSADDVRRFIQDDGYPTVAPVKGTPEFREEVESLKTRWASGDPTNPEDPNQVLVEAEETASAEWEAEYAGQATQRNQIANAEIKALNALQSSAVAMHDALGNAWVAKNLMEAESDPDSAWNTFIKDWPTTMGGNFSSDGKPVSVTADLATVKGRVDDLSATTTQNAKDAGDAADSATAAQASAAQVAAAAGLPDGRGLSYANESAQVTKAAAAATKATSLAMQTAVAATNATVEDSAALLADASAQAHAARAAYLRATAQDSAQKAAADAVAAQDKADAAAAAAAVVAKDKTTIAGLETSSKDAVARAATAEQTAAAEAQKAAAARATAESERTKAEAAQADAQQKAADAADREAAAKADSDTAADRDATARQAEQDAATARTKAETARKQMNKAQADSAAADAAAAAAAGTDAAAAADAAAKDAREQADAATVAAAQADDAADTAGDAAVAARSAANTASAAADKTDAAARTADAAAATTSANAYQGHALAAEAIEQSEVAAQNSDAANALAKDASQQAADAKTAAAGARTEADGAEDDAANASGQAYAASQQAEIARDTANAVTAPANEAIELGIAYAATDATAGLSVVVSDTAQTLAEQEVQVAELRADEAAAFAAAAQDAADRANGDAKLAAQAAADAAASAAKASRAAADALKSANQAAADSKVVQATSARLDGLNQQAQTSAFNADQSARQADTDATAARSAADDSEQSASSARSAADSAQQSADNAGYFATQAEGSAADADQAAAHARSDAQKAQDAAEATTELATNPPPADAPAWGDAGDDVPGLEVVPVNLKEDAQATGNCAVSTRIGYCNLPADIHITGTNQYYLVTCANPDATAAQCIASGSYDKQLMDSEPVDFTTHQVIEFPVYKFDLAFLKSFAYGMVSDYKECAWDHKADKCVWAIATLAAPVVLKGAFKAAYAVRAAVAIGDLAGMEAGFNVLTQLGKQAVIDARVATALKVAALRDWVRKFPEKVIGCTRVHSFVAGTPVLMADGTVKPIEEVGSGDAVENATPDGPDRVDRVARTFATGDDTQFTDLAVVTADGVRTVTSTQNHPYWDETQGTFVRAADLVAGDALQTGGSEPATVEAVRNYTGAKATYDLGIEGVHTYYVMAGTTPVLVHNNDCDINDLNDILAGLPVRADGDPTEGLGIALDGTTYPIISGDMASSQDLLKIVNDRLRAANILKGSSTSTRAADAEQKFAATMWQKGIDQAEIVINHAEGPCPGKLGCDRTLDAILGETKTLSVWWRDAEGQWHMKLYGGKK